mmetsp:Transcript_40777/g.121671  ORF Transcript_40777/g.121671 Transcript_40777/m.121671 type:complete len:209 (-) Transcript_40777:819-1445(-)
MRPKVLTPSLPGVCFSCSPTLRMFSRPSSATTITRVSLTPSVSHSGLMAPRSASALICSAVPPLVALEMAHAASFLMSYSAVASRLMSGATRLASKTDWICSLVPAVMLEMVQHASFLMLFLWLVMRRFMRHGSAPLLMMTCVCVSLPVTMLPAVRSAGTSTAGDGCISSSTSLVHTLASMTLSILSLSPSERYDSAQHASVRTSSSL